MIEHWCSGRISGLVQTLLLAAISVDCLRQLPQINVAGLNGSRPHDCCRLRKSILALSQPPRLASTPANHRSARPPEQVGPGEGIWSQVALVHMYAPGYARQSSRESWQLHQPRCRAQRYSAQLCLKKLFLSSKCLNLSAPEPNGILV